MTHIVLPHTANNPCSSTFLDSNCSVCVCVSAGFCRGLSQVFFHACTFCLCVLARHGCTGVTCHPPSITAEAGEDEQWSLSVCGPTDVCGFSGVEGSVVFSLPVCSIFCVPLNKHLCLDESISVSSPHRLVGDRGRWSSVV